MKIFVGCSARNNIPEKYYNDCEMLLNKLLNSNDLVFGAFHGGLMGLAHDITLKNNNKIIGICPDIYKHDFDKLHCNKEILTKNISDRTTKAIDNSDFLLFLPGGIGTIYELFTALECKRGHEFNKPIIIYNSNGFYDKLFEFIDILYHESFANITDKDLYFISNDIDEIVDYIANI